MIYYLYVLNKPLHCTLNKGNASAHCPANTLYMIRTNKCGMVFDLSGVLVFYPGADIRVQREVWSKVLEILCRGQRQKQVNRGRDGFLFQMISTEFSLQKVLGRKCKMSNQCFSTRWRQSLTKLHFKLLSECIFSDPQKLDFIVNQTAQYNSPL